MKNALIVVGKSLKYNEPFIDYLKSTIKKDVGELDCVSFVDERDANIYELFEYHTKNYDYLFVGAKDGFLLVGKILSTLTNDNLTLRLGVLIPSYAGEESYKDSYKLRCNRSFVNVLDIKENQEIPNILIKEKLPTALFLFYEDANDCNRFEKLAKVFKVGCLSTNLIEGIKFYNLSSKDNASTERFLVDAREMITSNIIVGDDIFKIVSKRLIEEGKTITFAESCTGGLLASYLVKNSGVSSIFKGSIVSYANEVKVNFLDVKEQTLEKYGAVSYRCVDEMLIGVEKKFNSDFSLAVSGVAGPDGGSKEKPVGTIFIGVKIRDKSPMVKKLNLVGDRRYIQNLAVLWAFKLLILSDKKLFFKFVPKTLDK